jgi:hypothetical protein
MRRTALFAVAFLMGAAGTASAAQQAQAPIVPPPVPYNFMGQNICMAVVKPQVAGMDILQVPQPMVRSEVTPGRRDAKHTVVFGDLGMVEVEEMQGSTEICSRNPRDRLLWTDNADGLRSAAMTCVTGIEAPRIYIRLAVQAANAERRAAVKSVVAAVAACDMAGSQVEIQPDDTLRIGTAVVPQARQ